MIREQRRAATSEREKAQATVEAWIDEIINEIGPHDEQAVLELLFIRHEAEMHVNEAVGNCFCDWAAMEAVEAVCRPRLERRGRSRRSIQGHRARGRKGTRQAAQAALRRERWPRSFNLAPSTSSSRSTSTPRGKPVQRALREMRAAGVLLALDWLDRNYPLAA